MFKDFPHFFCTFFLFFGGAGRGRGICIFSVVLGDFRFGGFCALKVEEAIPGNVLLGKGGEHSENLG